MEPDEKLARIFGYEPPFSQTKDEARRDLIFPLCACFSWSTTGQFPRMVNQEPWST
jgi:hypothetical protein